MILKIANKLISIACNLRKNKFYLFTQHPNYFSNIKHAKSLLCTIDTKIVENFERKFSTLIGSGSSVSFGAGRMGFYSLLRVLKISSGDEIILTSGTCSVMVNAILKLNAVPVFSDISEYTFGSDVNEISKKITSKTKVIVAQHNFGIPCEIDKIQAFCKSKNIFLLEDCALSLGSKYNGKNIGNFGDAALFSLDHSKPLSIFTGGIIYSNNFELFSELKNYQINLKDLNSSKQKAMFKKFKINNFFSNPKFFRFLYIINIYTSLKIKIGFISPYLDENYTAFPINESYHYPSKLPTFIACLGLDLIEKWEGIAKNRSSNFNFIMKAFEASNFSNSIPNVYFDTKFEIVPLRFILTDSFDYNLQNLLSKYIDVNSTWFKKPVISTSDELLSFNYKNNSCPKSELLGKQIINLPLEYEIKELKRIL